MKRFILFCMLVGCVAVHAQQLHTTIQYRVPAKSGLESDILSVLLVNNSPIQPKGLGHPIVYKQRTLQDSVALDEAAPNCLFALSRALEKQEWLNEVGLVVRNQNPSATFYSRKRLTMSQADSLIDLYGVDALLVLNQIIIYDKRESFLTDENDYYAYLEAYCTTQWAVYRQGSEQPRLFSHSDTLVWEARDYNETEALKELPNRQMALLDFASYTGERVALRLIPHWETADRYFYRNDNPLLIEGIEHMTHKRWGQAIASWTRAYERIEGSIRGKKKGVNALIETAAYAAANIAVAYEIEENWGRSVEWTDRAIALFTKLGTNESAQQIVNLRDYKHQVLVRSAYK